MSIDGYIWTEPNPEQDMLINSRWLCSNNGNVATVVQRGWTEHWQERIVKLSNKEIWGLQQFFDNWSILDETGTEMTDERVGKKE